VSQQFASQPFWRNTRVATLPVGGSTSLAAGTLGYEWDENLNNGSRPSGLTALSATTITVAQKLQDYGSTYGSGSATHALTLYRHASGALVFGAGTVQWSWGLDSHHDRNASTPDIAQQQAMVNLFADMGSQPGSLQPGLVSGTTDSTAPTVSMTAPAGGSTVSGTTVTVSATAADNIGVAGVQFKVDGASVGAEDTVSPYSVTWNSTTVANGSHTLTAVARDAAGNTTTATGVTVTVTNAVDNTAPTVSMTAPTGGSTVSGSSVTVSATASDNIGVAGVQFLLDGAATGAEVTTAPYAVVWNTTSSANGTHTLAARARDGAGNTTTSASVTVTVSNVGPSCPCSLWTASAVPARVEPDVNAVELGMKFTTDTAGAISGVRFYKYAQNTGTHTGSLWSTSGTRLATITFSGEGASGWQQALFTTPVAVTANTTYVISYHTNTGYYGVTQPGFSSAIDNSPVHAPSDAASGGNGLYQYSAAGGFPNQSYNASNYWVDVVFSPGPVDTTVPTVSLAAPANGATVSGAAVTVSATASDNVAVAGVQFKLDGANLGAEDTASPYSIAWNSTTVANGSHTLTAVARDAAGNTATATTVTVTVSNADTTAPTVAMSAPANGATVSGTAVTVSATASDNIGVAGVQFKLDGANLGAEDTVSPYSITWNSTTVANGSHTLTAVARDAAGNTATATTFTVTVNNDTTVPTVAMSAPASGVTVFGTVAVSATAADNVGVAGVQFKLDGANLGAEDTASPYSVNWNTTTAATGSHTLTAVARDAAGNTTTATTVTVTVNNNDITAPTVSMTAPANGATVSGTTVTVSATASDNIGVAGVQFQLDGVNLGAEDTASPYTLTWNSTTVANGSHTLTAVARDAAGNTTTATTFTVTVNNDTTAPTVSLTAPANGVTVFGTVAVSATAADNVAVAGVQFKLDGANLGAEDTASPYSVSWNTTTAATGSHTLTAVARDAAGNTTTATTLTVTVNNNDITAPTVSMTAPANGATVSGTTVTVSATASDNIGVAGVQFQLDGANLGAEDTVSPYSVTWNSTTVANGGHTLTAVARDAAGNTTTATTFTVTVNNDTTVPTVAMSAPASGATVSGTVTVSATASDNVGVAGVQFKLDGANLGAEDTASPYSLAWNSTTVANGSHTLTAVARDAAGNTATATSVTVTVSNTGPACPCSIWNASAVPARVEADPSAVELGLKFTTDTAGFVTGVRFYKYAQNTGTHTGSLWSATGTRLGTVTFSGETASGWQQALFTTPIAVAANTTYLISYHTNTGYYGVTEPGLTTAVDNAPLHALADGTSGGNGVYVYSAAGGFPNQTWDASNYWVDVVFTP